MPIQQPTSMFEGKHAIRFGGAIALLDVAGDAYSCFYDPTGRAGAGPLADSRRVEGAMARTPSGNDQRVPQWRNLPDADARVRPRDLRRFSAALAVTALQFRTRDFAALLGGSGGGPTPSEASPDALAGIVARFERMALFLPVSILCLFRAFFLRRFLASYGYSSDWVFGVTLFPFRAHCWLARGDLLLGETADRATQFSPILVIRAKSS